MTPFEKYRSSYTVSQYEIQKYNPEIVGNELYKLLGDTTELSEAEALQMLQNIDAPEGYYYLVRTIIYTFTDRIEQRKIE